VGKIMTEIKVDPKGRILLPKEIRSALDIRQGDVLNISQESNLVILKKITDPFKKLDELIGEVTFDTKNRRNIESLAIKLVKDNE
jgi:AbrB family looped-hinge helix DNA binding protein